MRTLSLFTCLMSVSAFSFPASADDSGPVKPNMVLQEIVAGLPAGAESEVRVFTASFKPGAKTPAHTHDFPVTVYVLEGAFTLEMKDRPPVTLNAGQAMVEPPNVEMTGYNRSASGETKVVVFYVSKPKAPFLNPLK
jgi:quercetin dioxygenase-like cupin family protein